MYATFVERDDLIDPLAAESYSPHLLKVSRRTARFTRLAKFLTQDPKLGVTGTIESDYVQADYPGAIPYLTTKQVNDVLAHPSECKFITPEADRRWTKCRVPDRAILINKSGRVGSAALLRTAPYKYVNTVSDLINIRVDANAIDPYFLVVFLNTDWSLGQIWRRTGGSVFDHVSIFEVPEVRVPTPAPAIQRAIGNKVRKAERLRELASALRKNIEQHFENLLASLFDSPLPTIAMVGLEKLETRLNAEYYKPLYTTLEDRLFGRFTKVVRLGDIAPAIRRKEKPTGSCRYLEIGDIDLSTGSFREAQAYESHDVPDNAQRRFDPYDIAVSTRRPNRGAIAVVDSADPDTYYSVFLARLKPKDCRSAYWLKEYLRTAAAGLMFERRCSWTTYPVISEDDIEDIPVPLLPDHWSNVERDCQVSHYNIVDAVREIAAAESAVESLIEGTLEEAALLAEGEAIEQWLAENPIPHEKEKPRPHAPPPIT